MTDEDYKGRPGMPDDEFGVLLLVLGFIAIVVVSYVKG
jgi:hypothetical protein